MKKTLLAGSVLLFLAVGSSGCSSTAGNVGLGVLGGAAVGAGGPEPWPLISPPLPWRAVKARVKPLKIKDQGESQEKFQLSRRFDNTLIYENKNAWTQFLQENYWNHFNLEIEQVDNSPCELVLTFQSPENYFVSKVERSIRKGSPIFVVCVRGAVPAGSQHLGQVSRVGHTWDRKISTFQTLRQYSDLRK